MEQLTEIILKLLDWPFLFTLVFIFGLRQFKTELQQLLSRGRISLMWGDKSFEISDLPEELDENFAPLSDDVEELKQRITELENELRGASRDGPPSMNEVEVAASGEGESTTDAKGRMLKALNDSQYTFRSIDRLASLAGVSNQEAESLLRPLDEVVFSRQNKTGRVIARLKKR